MNLLIHLLFYYTFNLVIILLNELINCNGNFEVENLLHN